MGDIIVCQRLLERNVVEILDANSAVRLEPCGQRVCIADELGPRITPEYGPAALETLLHLYLGGVIDRAATHRGGDRLAVVLRKRPQKLTASDRRVGQGSDCDQAKERIGYL